VITKARLADGSDDGALVIKCQPGYLEILELTAPSGRSMSGSEFIRGYKKA
jgi:methionyl-tRNA formyltransferase